MKAFSLLILHCVFLGKVRVVSTKCTRVYIYVYYIHLLEKRKRVGKKERAWVVFCCPLGLVFALSDPQSQRERVLDFVRERERRKEREKVFDVFISWLTPKLASGSSSCNMFGLGF